MPRLAGATQLPQPPMQPVAAVVQRLGTTAAALQPDPVKWAFDAPQAALLWEWVSLSTRLALPSDYSLSVVHSSLAAQQQVGAVLCVADCYRPTVTDVVVVQDSSLPNFPLVH